MYAQKTSGCCIVNLFIRLGLDPTKRAQTPPNPSYKDNLLKQVAWLLHSQMLSLTPKIGHSKKQKLDSNPRYGSDMVLTFANTYGNLHVINIQNVFALIMVIRMFIIKVLFNDFVN